MAAASVATPLVSHASAATSASARFATETTTVGGTLVAADVLRGIVVQNEHKGGYKRFLFQGDPAWLDLDGDGCDGRQQVLRRESLSSLTMKPSGCRVVSGVWVSVYDGLTLTSPSQIEVDHVVSLKEAWDSGAWAWPEQQRIAYANDVTDSRTLRAVSTSSNQSKGDRDPSNWMPPQQSDWCSYLGDWIAIKARWKMTMDQSEAGRIRNLLNAGCPGLGIAPWPPVPQAAPQPAATSPSPSPSTASAPAGKAATSGTAIPALASATPSAVYYQNCTAARAAGAAPLNIGDPGYRPQLDGDKDGIACEPPKHR